MGLADYLDVGKEAAENALYPFAKTGEAVYNMVPGQDWGGMADIAGDVGMGAMEIANAPFQAVGETVRGASEGEPLKMATAADQSGFRYPSIVQRLAPSTRTEHPPSDPFVKAYQGLEGLTNLPRGAQAASNVVTGEPDLAAQLGGMGLALGVLPPTVKNAELPEYLKSEKGGLTLGPGDEPPAPSGPPPEATPKWYSPLQERLQAKMQPRASVQDIKNIISKDIPQEEAQYRGFNKFLESKNPSDMLVKNEVMDYFEKNPWKIKETWYSGEPITPPKPPEPPRQVRDFDEGEYINEDEIRERAEEMAREEADRRLENGDFYGNFDPGPGYGVEKLDQTEAQAAIDQANAERGVGQKDLWGNEIEPLPDLEDKYVVMYDRDPVEHRHLSRWHQEKSVPDEEGHAVFANEDDAREAYYEHIQEDESNAADEAYRDFLREHDADEYMDAAGEEVGVRAEPEEEAEVEPEPEPEPASREPLLESEADRLARTTAPGGHPYAYQMRSDFNSYTTPGATKHRALVMSLPDIQGQFTPPEPLTVLPPGFEPIHDASESSTRQWGILPPGQQHARPYQGYRYPTKEEAITGTIKLLNEERADKAFEQFRETHPEFTSGHFPEVPNAFVAPRFKDYVAPEDGAKGLIFEENQSDWHEEGRQEGYIDPAAKNNATTQLLKIQVEMEQQYKKLGDNVGQADKGNGSTYYDRSREEDGDYITIGHIDDNGIASVRPAATPEQADAINKIADLQRLGRNYERIAKEAAAGKVPDAPLKDKWHELGFKRALAEAVHAGYDELLIPKGEHQAERYSLRKHVDYIDVTESDAPNNANKSLNFKFTNGESAEFEVSPDGIIKDAGGRFHQAIGQPLTRVVPKAVADQLMQANGRVKGGDLKIGGEGLMYFYDKRQAPFVRKYIKRYDGVMDERTVHASDGDRIYDRIKITPKMRAEIPTKGQSPWLFPAMIGTGAAGAAAGAAKGAQANEQKYAKGGIVREDNMPFQSQAQRGFMYAKHPKIAKRFEEETPKDAKLPEHVKKMSRGGMAGDWKDDLAGYMNQHFSGKSGKTQHLAPGGMAGIDNSQFEDLSQSGTSFPGNLGLATPPPMGSMPTPSTGPVFNARNGLPPPPPPEVPMPSTPAPAPDTSYQDYLAQLKSSLSKYGPEEQLALEQAIQKQRTGFLPNLANAGAGFADAIMQGVARAGPSNFQSNLQSRLDKTQEGQRSALEHAQTGNLARMKQEMELAQMDPVSPVSRTAQRAWGSSLKKLPGGQDLTDEQIALLPASTIADLFAKKIDLSKAIQEANAMESFRLAQLDIQRGAAKESGRAHRAEETNTAEKTGFEKDKEAASHYIASPLKALGARRRLAAGSSGGATYSPDVISYATKHGISNEAAKAQKDRRMKGQ